jgi:cytochrome P450
LSGTVFQLLKHPEALKRTVKEIRSAFTSSDEIDLYSTTKLQYMLAVLDETMRIYPPVPSQPTRQSPLGGDTVDGKFVPENTVIYVSQYAMNHLSTNFVKHDEFHPERFLHQETDMKESQFANDNFAVFQPFSVGPRNCIGRNLAYAEMRLILARLLFDFDLELDEISRDWAKRQKSFILWEKPALWVKVTAREG